MKYRAFAAAVAAMMLVGTTAAMAAGVAGDMNNDGKCDSQDVRLVQEYLLGKGGKASDINQDGVVNAFDLAALKRNILNPTTGAIKDYGTAPNENATLYANFRKGSDPAFFASDGWTNGSMFDCGWYETQTSFKDGALNLTLDKDYTGKYNYAGAEYRTQEFYGYGYYETSMQAIKNDGVVSSFFTYTGPSDDNPWDEIDIEILGKDTTKVQFNYFTDGKGDHEFLYDLGFDASEGYHTYGFDWQPDHITWYVDGKPVYTANQNIPTTPGKIMMNVWPGTGVDAWLNHYDGKTPLTARYQWVTYNANGEVQQPTDPKPTEPQNPSGKDYMNANATLVADFRKGATPSFFASDGWTNGSCFDCGWYESQTSLKDGVLNLTLDKDYTGKYNYAGAEYRTQEFYGYGYYETSMKAISNPGVVSSFFTYTGPSDDNPWDEIDIEILGKDTTKVQFNYYTDGKGDHEFMYDLGFDASKEFHRYGFDWQPDHITWYVDGVAVYTANTNIPSTPGKIMMNVWPGTGVDNWLGHYDGKTPLTAQYEWVTYDKSANAQQPSNPQQPSGNDTMDATADLVADFRKGATPTFFASDGWTNGSCFDCGWYESQTSLNGGVLSLTLDKDYTGKYNYAGAEYRTQDFYGYGYYETSMQAISNPGVVSSFFTYTGPSDDNPWDEIDVEVLGKDTTKVQFNYYTNGKGDHEFMYDLGFDASKGFHRYGFDWQPDHITWYVDGVAVYTANTNIPSTPGKIMMNVWPGTGVDNWLGHYDGKTPLTAKYEWVTYKKK